MPPERIILIRHGIAVDPADWTQDDDLRPLTPVGERRVAQAARGLKELDIRADRIVSSPLPRAWRTAEIVAEELRLAKHLEAADALRADASAPAIKRFLLDRSERRLIAVGHNLAFSELIGSLCGVDSSGGLIAEMRKGGAVAMSLTEGDRYLVDWLMTPKLLRRLA